MTGPAGQTLRNLARATTVGIALVAAVAALVALLTAASGHEPSRALAALWRGSLGTRYAIMSATLVRATPLMLTGLAVAWAFTAGVLNIGAEGQLLAGAAASVAIGLSLGHSLGRAALPLALTGGAVAGSAWAFVPAWFRQRFGVLEVISTIMMNFVASYLVSYLVRGPLQEPLRIYPQSPPLPEATRLPLVFSGARLHWGFIIALGCAVSLAWVLRSTAAGFRLRIVGASPDAARSAGLVDTGRTALHAFLASGFLAGLAGAVETTGVTYSLYDNLSPGYGYTAIAVALVGSLDPMLTALSAILFGALEAGASAMQRDAGVPSVVASVVEASIIVLLVVFNGLRSRMVPAHRGRTGWSWLARTDYSPDAP